MKTIEKLERTTPILPKRKRVAAYDRVSIAFCDPRRPRLRSKNGHRAVTERPACGVEQPFNSAVRLQP